MESSMNESRGSVSPTCSLSFFDCLRAPSPSEEHRRASRHIGVEREMKVMYQQPHLVPPMKLTVYDDLPATPRPPPPSAISQLVSQGRNLASRASERASVSVRRKHVRPQISRPELIEDPERPRRGYRRLELSIYLPQNRLSDLPEFDHVAFADDGAIQLPPRALLRARSEENLSRTPAPIELARKTSSMYEERMKTMHTRQHTTSSIISTSRPPSEYDALHSHPVSMISVPGLPTQIFHQPTNSVTVLSPIQDEFTPPTSSAVIDGMVMDFPIIDNKVQERGETPLSLKQLLPKPAPAPVAAPLKFSFKSRSYSNSTSHSKSLSKSTTTTSQSRVDYWINHSKSSSISSSYSTLTAASMSFSEHRRKKSQFYQCQPYIPNQPQVQPQTQSFTPPKALSLHSHSRTRTHSDSTVSSTADTVDTNIMSLDSDGDSLATMDDAAVVQDIRTGGRARSYSKPLVSAVIKEVDLPLAYAEIVSDVRDGMVVKELNGMARSPGVGLAF